MTWKKVRGGLEVEWIGYFIDLSTYRIGISLKKKEWIYVWIEKR